MHYTSGTTGRPKGVRRPLTGLDPDDMAGAVNVLLQMFGITAGPPNAHLVTSPNYHTAVTSLRRRRRCTWATRWSTWTRWDAEQALALVRAATG